MNTQYTISTAESCTGGNIAHLITMVAGSSSYFKGSVVSYSNEVKINVLGVPASYINEFGAVSKIVVEAMAIGVRKLMDTDYAVSTSGIAGPDGGSEDKPIGTIWIAICNRQEVKSRCLHLSGSRIENIKYTSKIVLQWLRDEYNLSLLEGEQ
ncbi:MAG: CinA family protein [Bacteroidia bacterium]|nr:CinA family protein [Bacteroidia bacterium]